MMTPAYKVYEEIWKTRSIPERVAILKKYDYPALKEFIAYVVNPNIQFILPPTKPPYKPSDGINMEEAMYNRINMLQYFVAHCGKPVHQMSSVKRETMFIEFLENIHPKDAELILRMKETKTLGVTKARRYGLTGITANIASQAFPGYYKFLEQDGKNTT